MNITEINLKHNRLTSGELLKNYRRAVGFGSKQLGLRDEGVQAGGGQGVRLRRRVGFKSECGGGWTMEVLKGEGNGGGD